ncbi:MAG: hypothetical protein LBC69_04400 [Eubacteriaceae bacterium]|jgi:hypothetical protein|nr:hypothetical protein [Eubacteriaceae bacterium]
MKISNTRYTTEEILALFPDAKIDHNKVEGMAKRSIPESLAQGKKPVSQFTSRLVNDVKCAVNLDVYSDGSYALYGAIPEEVSTRGYANYTIFKTNGNLWSAQFTISCNDSTNEISSVSGGSASATIAGSALGYAVSGTSAVKISNRKAEMTIYETLTIINVNAYTVTTLYKLTATTTSTTISSVLRPV